MAKFKFKLESLETGNELVLDYDNTTSELKYENGEYVVPKEDGYTPLPHPKMDAGKRNLKKIKIQLGLKCNYSCEYCSQRFIPRNSDDSYNQVGVDHDKIESFIAKFDDVDVAEELHFEMWGGEPFLYFENMKAVTKKLHAKYPHATFSVITNGSIINQEVIDFVNQYDYAVCISHDGSGQKTRGPDPMENPEQRKWLLKMRDARLPVQKFSVNAMIHKDNESRADVQAWILDRFGDNVPIGEGGTIDSYDEGGKNQSWKTNEEHIAYRRKAFKDHMEKKTFNFVILNQKLDNFVNSLKQQRPSGSLPQKCGMDQPDIVALDLNGNVTTCQNVTVSTTNPEGISHHIGDISDLENVNIKTGTHWSDREECPKCPVLHLCQGSCLYLNTNSEEWKLSCDNAYSDNVSWLATSLFDLTGYVLYRIEGDLPEYRKDVFGFETEKYAVEVAHGS